MTSGGDKMLCAAPRCRYKNAPHARYCARCGKALSFCYQSMLGMSAEQYLQQHAAQMQGVQPDLGSGLGGLNYLGGMLDNPFAFGNEYPNKQRILEDDSREDTHGCSFAAWGWFQSWTLLGWIVAAVLAIWLLAKLGWEAGRWIGG